MSDTEDLLHQSTLQFTAAVVSKFCAIIAIYTYLPQSWVGLSCCPHSVKLFLPHVYPWCHACDKIYQALTLLGMRKYICIHICCTQYSPVSSEVVSESFSWVVFCAMLKATSLSCGCRSEGREWYNIRCYTKPVFCIILSSYTTQHNIYALTPGP